MNEQEKKAFERWFLEYPSWVVTMSRQESCSKAWQAACEYKQKEIDEIKKKLNVCKNDYWFMINLIERYSTDKEQALNDCLERMKFRKGLFNILGDEND